MSDQTQVGSQVSASADAPAASSPASPQTPQTATAAAPASPVRPDWLPETFWDAEKGEAKADDFKKHLSDLEQLRTATDAARGQLPSEPEGYKLELPSDVKLPDGYEPNDKEAKFIGLRKIAHEDGLSQSTVNKIVRLEAQTIVDHEAKIKLAIAARDKALGENGAARVASLEKFIDAHWPVKEEAYHIKKIMLSPTVVKHFETYQQMVSSQGAHSFTQAGRTVQDANDGKPEGWATASPESRRAWQLGQQRESTAPRH